MEKAVLKLIDLMEEDNKKLRKNIVLLNELNFSKNLYILREAKEALKSRQMFITYLKGPINDERGEIFANFNELSSLLCELPLKIKEKFDIIMYIIKKNIDTGILIESNYFNMEVINNYSFKSAPKEEALAFAKSKTFWHLEDGNNITITEKERAIYEELKKVAIMSSEHIKPVVEAHFTLAFKLIHDLPNIDRENIDEIILAFEKCGLSKELVQEIKDYLNIVAKKKSPTVTPVKRVINNKPILSNKELKTLNRELSQYYDFDSDNVQRPVTLDEELHVISIMQQLGFSENIMTNILNKFKKISCMNPIVLYVRLYDKYAQYQDNEEVKKLLQELENYFQDSFICDNEEYSIIKMCFEDTFNKLLNLIPDNYEYEFKQARLLKR